MLTTVLTLALATAVIAVLAAGVLTRRELRLTRAGHFQVLNSLEFGLFLLHADGTVEIANGVATDVLGRRQSEIVGRSSHQVLHEAATADEQGIVCDLEAAIRLHQPYRGQERFLGTGGRSVPVLASCVPLTDDSHKMVILFRDLSSDIALKQQRDEVFASVAHEIRGPLTAVAGYSARLRAAVTSGVFKADPQRGEEVALLAREAQRMGEMIMLVLDVAEIERGSLDVDVEPVQVNRLVEAAIDRVRSDRPTARIVLDAEQDLVVESDGRHLRRVVRSLVDDAARYGGDTEAVEVTLTSCEGGGCRLVVRDHGTMIPVKTQPEKAEPSYRHEGASILGRRLDLAPYLSRQLALRLGGQLTFASTPGDGATFSLTLPAVCPEAPPERTQVEGTLFL